MATNPTAGPTPAGLAGERSLRRESRPGLFSRLATETKHALKTTEFYAFIVVLIALLIAGNSIESAEGGPDRFAADKVWLYATILTVGYMVSRGLAKSGSNEPYWEESGSNRERTTDRDDRT